MLKNFPGFKSPRIGQFNGDDVDGSSHPECDLPKKFFDRVLNSKNMTGRQKWIGCVLISWCVLAANGSEAFTRQGTAVSVKLGTLGIGGEVVHSLWDDVNGKIGFNIYNGNYDLTDNDDLEYDIEASLRSVSFLVDWHPYEGEFRVSGGVLYNGSHAEVRGIPLDSVKIGDTYYSPAELGILKYDFDFRNIAPYLGIGVGNALQTYRTFGFVLDVGLLFQGSPRVDMTTAYGSLSNQALRNDLRQEEEELEDDLSPIRVYPVVSFGFTYRFQ